MSVSHNFCLLLLLLLLLVSATQTEKERGTKITIMHDFVLASTKADLIPAKKTLKKVVEVAHRLQDRDSNSQPSVAHPTTVFNNTIATAKNLLEDIAIIEGLSVRSSRGLNIIGDLLHAVAGTPSADMHNSLIERVELLETRVDKTTATDTSMTDKIKILTDSLKDENEHLSDMTDVLKIHEDRIQKVEEREIQLHNLIEFNSLSLKIIGVAQENLRKIGTINSGGKSFFLSVYAINTRELKDILQAIALRATVMTPIFHFNLEKYYSHRLVRTSWRNGRLFTTLKIPLINAKESYHLKVISQAERERSKVDLTSLTFKAVNDITGGFMYISESEFKECSRIEDKDKGILCQKRKIEMRSPDVLAHELAPTQILIVRGSNSSSNLLKITCSNGEKTKHLGNAEIIHIREDCNALHKDFFVGKLEYTAGENIITREEEIQVTLKQEQYKASKEAGSKIQGIEEGIKATDSKLEKVSDSIREMEERQETFKQQLESHSNLIKYVGGGISISTLVAITVIGISLCLLKNALTGIR